MHYYWTVIAVCVHIVFVSACYPKLHWDGVKISLKLTIHLPHVHYGEVKICFMQYMCERKCVCMRLCVYVESH